MLKMIEECLCSFVTRHKSNKHTWLVEFSWASLWLVSAKFLTITKLGFMCFINLFTVDKKMKSKKGWGEVTKGTNSSGFSGLPGGSRDFSGWFEGSGRFYLGNWWSSTEYTKFKSIRCTVNWYDDDAKILIKSNSEGLSVRCIKDWIFAISVRSAKPVLALPKEAKIRSIIYLIASRSCYPNHSYPLNPCSRKFKVFASGPWISFLQRGEPHWQANGSILWSRKCA